MSSIKYTKLDDEEPLVESSLKKNSQTFKFKRNINLLSGISIVTGNIIGSGVFVIPSNIMNYCNGDVKLSFLVWILSGIVAILVALCHCELGTLIAESGGASVYLRKSFGDWICFIYLWLVCLTVFPESIAVQSIAFGDYISNGLYQTLKISDYQSADSFVQIVAVLILTLIAYINIISVKSAINFQVFCTFGKVIALVLISLFGLIQLFNDKTLFMENLNSNVTYKLHDSTSSIFVALSLAVYEGLWAYDGFDSINVITEEVKNPSKTLPRVIILSITFVMGLYILVFISFLSVLSVNEIRQSTAIALDYSIRINPWLSKVITFCVCLSLMGSINSIYIFAGRVPFVAARMNFMPKIFGMLHIRHVTPVPGLIALSTLSILLLLFSNIHALMDATIFCGWIFKGLCCIAVLILRKKMKNKKREYKVYKGTAVLSSFVVFYLILCSLIVEPKSLYFLNIIFALLFYILYNLVEKGYVNFKKMSKNSVFLQSIMLCAPTNEFKGL